jgi:hypothetical protein
MKQVNTVIAIATLGLGIGGCVLGVTKVDVAHSPLSGEMTKREGTVLVKQFSDGRQPGHREHIGNKRNGFGMVLGHIGTQDGVNLEALLTRYFVEALGHAGYNAVLQPSAWEATLYRRGAKADPEVLARSLPDDLAQRRRDAQAQGQAGKARALGTRHSRREGQSFVDRYIGRV